MPSTTWAFQIHASNATGGSVESPLGGSCCESSKCWRPREPLDWRPPTSRRAAAAAGQDVPPQGGMQTPRSSTRASQNHASNADATVLDQGLADSRVHASRSPWGSPTTMHAAAAAGHDVPPQGGMQMPRSSTRALQNHASNADATVFD